ncbi:MAG: putative dsRNA-binding protein, partial [Ktedonobacteraceae bacterium]
VELLSKETLDTNPKGRLQKIVLQRSGSLPRYRIIEQSGQNNDRVFTVGVFERDTLLAIGTASSIKEAGRIAAREALELMHDEGLV